MDDLLKFILHMVGHPQYRGLPPAVQSHHIEHWLKHFNLERAIHLERDLFGDYLAETMGKSQCSGMGFFATPMSISMLIAELTLSKADLFSSVMDPCVGTGRLLLAASNYSLCLYGQDINPVCLRATLVNAALYAPQILFPPPKDLKRPREARAVVIPYDVIQRLSKEMQNGKVASSF